MAELTLVVATHHFTVRDVQAGAYKHVISFAQKYVQWGTVRVQQPGRRPIFKRGPLRVFAASTGDRKEFRFHINCLREFLEHLNLNFVRAEQIQRIEAPLGLPRKVTLPVKPEWQDREHQVPAIAYGLEDTNTRSKFIDLQTGKGKSYIALRIMSERGVLPVIIVKPMYIDKWILDIRKTYDIAIEDLMVVKGSEALQTLLVLAQADQLTCKMILVSNKTIQNWIKLYEKFGRESLDLGYACTPDEFFAMLQSGFRLIDEVHQDFHLNFKIDLYSHVERSLSLSATLLGDDDFVNRMYELAYPLGERYQGGVYDKYANAESIIFSAERPQNLRWIDPGSKNYSHHVLEKSIMRQPQVLQNYFRLVKYVVDNIWLNKDYVVGEKAIVFVASIAMATALTDYLRKMYPGKDVRRYVEDDPYENLMEPDLRVSTLLSAGTAVDIDNLTACLMTTALSSSQGNVQGFGRLRKLKSGKTPTFAYFVCQDIPKHVEYHEKKRKILETRALNYRPVYIPQPI